MSNSILSGRYAKAVFDLALEGKSLRAVESDLFSLRDLLQKASDLEGVVNSPVIPKAEQMAAMLAILKKSKAHDLTVQFIGMLTSKGRLSILKSVVDSFSELVKTHKGEVVANVISATPLSKKRISEMEKVLGVSFGKKVMVDLVIDKEILGGVIVTIGSKMWDASVLGGLNKLESLSKSAIEDC